MTARLSIDGLHVLPTRHNVADIMQRVVSMATAKGLTIFAQIDFSGDAARAGQTLVPTGMVIFGNPAAGTPLIAATPSVAIDLPLKILAWHDVDFGTRVAYIEPDYLRTRHGFPAELVKNIAAIGALAAAAAADG
jgi:uncharacterized protein (DUF302 family)